MLVGMIVLAVVVVLIVAGLVYMKYFHKGGFLTW